MTRSAKKAQNFTATQKDLMEHSIRLSFYRADALLMGEKPPDDHSGGKSLAAAIDLRRFLEIPRNETWESAGSISQRAKAAVRKDFRERNWSSQINDEIFGPLGAKNDDDVSYPEKLKSAIEPPFLPTKMKQSPTSKKYPDRLFGFDVWEGKRMENQVHKAYPHLKYFGKNFLQTLEKLEIYTSPINLDEDLCFPWAIHEAKRMYGEDTQLACKVYEQIGRGAAVCINHLADLLAWGDDRKAIGHDVMPIIAFTTIGPTWTVYIVYRYDNWTNVSSVWKGDIRDQENAAVLLGIVEQARIWALETFRPWIAEQLEPHFQNLITYTNPPSPPKMSPSSSPRSGRKNASNTAAATPTTNRKGRAVPSPRTPRSGRKNASNTEAATPTTNRKGRIALSDVTNTRGLSPKVRSAQKAEKLNGTHEEEEDYSCPTSDEDDGALDHGETDSDENHGDEDYCPMGDEDESSDGHSEASDEELETKSFSQSQLALQAIKREQKLPDTTEFSRAVLDAQNLLAPSKEDRRHTINGLTDLMGKLVITSTNTVEIAMVSTPAANDQGESRGSRRSARKKRQTMGH